jgi:hypothetical protein
MKRLKCGCRITEQNDSLVRHGVLGIGDQVEDCGNCRVPNTATYYSTDEECWVRLNLYGVIQGYKNSEWFDFNEKPRGIIQK